MYSFLVYMNGENSILRFIDILSEDTSPVILRDFRVLEIDLIFFKRNEVSNF